MVEQNPYADLIRLTNGYQVSQAILSERARIKRQTIQQRRLLHQSQAA